MRNTLLICLMVISSLACSGTPYRPLETNEVIENELISVHSLGDSWVVSKSYDKTKNYIPNFYMDGKGVSYTITIQFYPFDVIPNHNFFNPAAEYPVRTDDSQVEYSDNDREQGIGYKRLWFNYVQGLKCGEGVFSRNHGGLMSSITSKNYSLTCGYYNTAGEKQLISISYRYNYAGGSVRHEQDKDTPREELLTLQQAELGIKQSVKKLVSTLNIKNMDRSRMEQEGLLHNNKTYEIYPY